MSAKYENVASTILEEINAKKFPSGKLPSEEVLVRRFSVARGTVRKALDELQRQGVIESRRGSGYYLTTTGMHRTNRIGLLMPEITFTPFFHRLAHEVSVVAEEAGIVGTVAGPGTLTATGGFNPGGADTIGTMTLSGGATLVGDVALDFAANGTCDQLVFAPGATYDVSGIRLVPSASGESAWNATERFVIGSAADATLTGTLFDISAFPNAQVRQKPNGDLELLVPKGTKLIIR